MGLSIRAYARQRGVSHVAVLRAAKGGRIPLEPDGTVDPAQADAAWERSTEPGRAEPQPERKARRPVSEAAVSSVRELGRRHRPSGFAREDATPGRPGRPASRR